MGGREVFEIVGDTPPADIRHIGEQLVKPVDMLLRRPESRIDYWARLVIDGQNEGWLLIHSQSDGLSGWQFHFDVHLIDNAGRTAHARSDYINAYEPSDVVTAKGEIALHATVANLVRDLEVARRDKVIEDQPEPVGGKIVVLHYVLHDIRERAETGKARYGTYLKTYNGRDALTDAYQEALDLVMYLRQAILERDGE